MHRSIHSCESPALRVQKLNENSVFFGDGDVLEDEPVALFDTRLRSPSRGQLERGDGVSRARDAPGREAMPDADDRAVAGEEDDVDREAHEEHVHRAGTIDEHPAPRLETVSAEQPTHPTEGALGNLAPLAEDHTCGRTHPGEGRGGQRFV